MEVKWLKLAFAIIFMLTQIPSAHSQSLPSFDRYGKLGIGPCPKVKAMNNFDVTKLYGGSWYFIAHFSEPYMLDRHCAKMELSDANPGKDTCRVFANRTSIEYDDGEIKAIQFYFLLPNEKDHAAWIDTVHDIPSKTWILDTDYSDYLLLHHCNQYPRDNPFFFEQDNLILSRTAVWPGGLNDFQKALKIYESFGIDSGTFVLHDQDNCIKES